MILIAVISLGAIGAVGAVFLYAASKKFEVYEDPASRKYRKSFPGELRSAVIRVCGRSSRAPCVKLNSIRR